MREVLAVVTGRGQVTIPAEIRKTLDLKRGDVVAFTVPEQSSEAVTVRRAPRGKISVVERTAGALASDQPMGSLEEEAEAAEQAWVDAALGLPDE